MRVTITSMVESASRASARGFVPASCADAVGESAGAWCVAEAGGVAGAVAGVPSEPGAGGGGMATPPCQTDQPTTAQAANCRQKATETLRRSHA